MAGVGFAAGLAEGIQKAGDSIARSIEKRKLLDLQLQQQAIDFRFKSFTFLKESGFTREMRLDPVTRKVIEGPITPETQAEVNQMFEAQAENERRRREAQEPFIKEKAERLAANLRSLTRDQKKAVLPITGTEIELGSPIFSELEASSLGQILAESNRDFGGDFLRLFERAKIKPLEQQAKELSALTRDLEKATTALGLEREKQKGRESLQGKRLKAQAESQKKTRDLRLRIANMVSDSKGRLTEAQVVRIKADILKNMISINVNQRLTGKPDFKDADEAFDSIVGDVLKNQAAVNQRSRSPLGEVLPQGSALPNNIQGGGKTLEQIFEEIKKRQKGK